MATKKAPPAGATKVRVLVDCSFGKADDVVELLADELDVALASGAVDPDPAAVAYAETLKG